MLYSESIYCDEKKWMKPRPNNWYSTSRGCLTSLTKFAWVNPPKIAFECSYQSQHDPLHIEWTTEKSREILKHNRYTLPFGVLSSKEENSLFWRHCSINYLIEYNFHFKENVTFSQLISSLDVSESTPVHWLEAANNAKKGMVLAKAKFKACRKHEKSSYGLISIGSLPRSVKRELIAFARLKQYIKNIPHNQMLAVDHLELFLSTGFDKLTKRYCISEEELADVEELGLDRQLNVLEALLKERITVPRHVKNVQGQIVDTNLVVDGKWAMNYFLCFSSDVFDGGMKHLNGFKKLKEMFGDIQDVTTWFAKKHLSH
jgi:hypothetical protein